MKFHLFLLSLAFLFFQNDLKGQCTPGTFTDPGFYPDAMTGLEVANTGETTYSATINFKSELDTLFSGFTVPFDSISGVTIDGLPSSFSFNCQNPTCSVMISLAGENTLCFEISGDPSVETIGSYPLTITIDRWITVFGFPVEVQTVNTDYALVIEEPVAAIPTLSQWGIIILSSLVLIFGVVALRQKIIRIA